MIHFVPDPPSKAAASPQFEVLVRIAGLRNALRLVGGEAEAPFADDETLVAAWDKTGAANRRCFAARSERAIGAAAAGIEAVLAERQAGREPSPRSLDRLAGEIRGGLDELQRLLAR